MYRFVLFLLLLTTVPGYSQRRIPLEEAIGLALRNNTALKVSADRIQIADARFRQVKDRALPQTSASLQAARLSILSPFELNMGGPEPAFALPPTSFWSTIGMVSAGKEIFSGFAEKSAHKSAELLAQASRLDAEKDSREIEYAVVASYYNIYKLMQSARILDENRELLLRKEQDVKNMLREGILTSNELLKIQLQQSNLELSRVDVRNAQEAALFNLGTLLGVETPVAIDTTLKLTDALPDQLGDLLGQAETSRSELKANVLRIKSAESNLTQTRSVLYPHVSASAMYLYLNPNKNVIPDRHTFLQAVNLGVSVHYSISSLYAAKGKIQEARLNIDQARHLNTLQEEQIRNEVFGLFRSGISAREKIRVSETALAQASRSFTLTESKFRNGLLLSSDLLESQNLLLQAQLQLLNSRVDAQLTYYKLQKAIGNPVH